MSKRTIILAAGGTGGHVFPAQALAETLVSRGWRVFLVTDHRGNSFSNKFPEKVQKLVLDITNPRGGGKLSFILSWWLLIRSVFIIFKFCLKVKANVIVGFGGYPSATSMAVAYILRIPSAIHEQNAVLGRVNKVFQNRVDLLVFGMNPTFPQHRKSTTRVFGNPIRQSVMKINPTQYSSLPSGSFLILVIGGSQGANFISSIACNAILNLPKKLRSKVTVWHQCRNEYIIDIKRKYDSFKIESETKSFFSDISLCLNKANLIIGRSGASSVAELCIFGRPSILIPLPSAVGNHQALNAEVMEKSGASIVLDQNSVTSDELSKNISFVLDSFEVANSMALSAQKLSKPNAALDFAVELENLVF